MKKLLYSLTATILLLTSCEETHTTGDAHMTVDKFQYEGNHYIHFHQPNSSNGGGITLDPDYLFTNKDTITYKGQKYIKINE